MTATRGPRRPSSDTRSCWARFRARPSRPPSQALDGRFLFRNRHSIGEDRARYFAYADTRRKSGSWPPGVYRSEFVVSGKSPAGPFRIEHRAEITLQ